MPPLRKIDFTQDLAALARLSEQQRHACEALATAGITMKEGWSSPRSLADSARYKQMGNAVAVPCVEWIMRNLVAYSLKNTPSEDA